MPSFDFSRIRRLTGALAWNASFDSALKECIRLLRREVPHYNWVGFYWVENDDLVLGDWDGPAATEHERIPMEKGVCGLSAGSGETVVVPDVSKDHRYLACFLNTRSEIVAPIFASGKTVGLIDIDSDELDPFTDADVKFLEGLAVTIGAHFNRSNN